MGAHQAHPARVSWDTSLLPSRKVSAISHHICRDIKGYKDGEVSAGKDV